jgi:HemY protein
MRRLLIFCLTALLASIGLIALIEKDPGYVLVSYSKTTVETSFWVGLLIVSFSFFFIYALLHLYQKIMSLGSSRGSGLRNGSNKRSQRLTTASLINFIEGNWNKSRHMSLQAAKSSETPLVNYIIAARASNELGDPERALEYLHAAQNSELEAGIAVELLQAELQLSNGQLEGALATMVRARKNPVKHPYVLRLLMQVYLSLKDWEKLSALLPELKKHEVIDGKQWLQLQRKVNLNILHLVAKASEDSVVRLERLQSIWTGLSNNLRQDRDIAHSYVCYLHDAAGDWEAEKVILGSLKKNWDEELVYLYGIIEGRDLKKQLLTAEIWLKEQPNSAALMLCLGRLSLRNELWGKAKRYFEASFKLEQKPETCAELGRLLGSLKELKASNQYFKRGLMLSEQDLPQLPQPETHTLAGS